MKAILIDPFNVSVTEVEHNGDYKHIYTLLSHPEHPVTCFTVVGIENDDAIYVDDEGLFKEPKHFFIWNTYPQPLAGRGLILGTNADGDSKSPVITVDQVKERVSFHNDIRLSHFDDISGTVDHPLLGPNTPMIGHRPVFVKAEDDNESKI